MPATPVAGPRDWATRAVQWDPARNTLKRAAHGFAWARGGMLERTHRVPGVANIYAASSPKAGSQWMKALFDHPVVRAHSGLFTLPQLDYKLVPRRRFPLGTFVPGLYVSYPEYQQISHRHPHRVLYMFRDPRDLVVSGYWSATRTHRDTHVAEVEELRDQLRSVPFDEGLLQLIESAGPALQDVESWIGVEDPNVHIARLEEVSADPRGEVDRILRHCGVDLRADELEAVLQDVSREALQEKDLALRGDGESHYRVDRKTFRDVFKPQHHDALERVAPGLVARLGYPD